MATQQTFFDHPARASDPETSHEGAANLDISGARLDLLNAAKSITYPATAYELAEIAIGRGSTFGRETLRKRVNELVKLNRLTVLPKRTCSVTTNNALTYRATPPQHQKGGSRDPSNANP